jgi:hypothetical protein
MGNTREINRPVSAVDPRTIYARSDFADCVVTNFSLLTDLLLLVPINAMFLLLSKRKKFFSYDLGSYAQLWSWDLGSKRYGTALVCIKGSMGTT